MTTTSCAQASLGLSQHPCHPCKHTPNLQLTHVSVASLLTAPPLPHPNLSPQAHSTCVSEHEKYALGATKPGGYAAQGFFHEGQAQQVAAAAAADSEAVGLEFLSERPPWRCSCCNVNCTSRETLMGHAAGAKHKRRVSGVMQVCNAYK